MNANPAEAIEPRIVMSQTVPSRTGLGFSVAIEPLPGKTGEKYTKTASKKRCVPRNPQLMGELLTLIEMGTRAGRYLVKPKATNNAANTIPLFMNAQPQVGVRTPT